VLFPELGLPGYSNKDLFHQDASGRAAGGHENGTCAVAIGKCFLALGPTHIRADAHDGRLLTTEASDTHAIVYGRMNTRRFNRALCARPVGTPRLAQFDQPSKEEAGALRRAGKHLNRNR